MQKLMYLAGALLLVLPVQGQSAKKITEAPVAKAPVTSGKQMFETYCAVCHGKNGTGDGAAASALKTKPANLTLLSKNNHGVFPAEHVAAVLRFGVTNPAHGTAEMPIWSDMFATLSDRGAQTGLRVINLTNYLKTIQVK